MAYFAVSLVWISSVNSSKIKTFIHPVQMHLHETEVLGVTVLLCKQSYENTHVNPALCKKVLIDERRIISTDLR